MDKTTYLVATIPVIVLAGLGGAVLMSAQDPPSEQQQEQQRDALLEDIETYCTSFNIVNADRDISEYDCEISFKLGAITESNYDSYTVNGGRELTIIETEESTDVDIDSNRQDIEICLQEKENGVTVDSRCVTEEFRQPETSITVEDRPVVDGPNDRVTYTIRNTGEVEVDLEIRQPSYTIQDGQGGRLTGVKPFYIVSRQTYPAITDLNDGESAEITLEPDRTDLVRPEREDSNMAEEPRGVTFNDMLTVNATPVQQFPREEEPVYLEAGDVIDKRLEVRTDFSNVGQNS